MQRALNIPITYIIAANTPIYLCINFNLFQRHNRQRRSPAHCITKETLDVAKKLTRAINQIQHWARR